MCADHYYTPLPSAASEERTVEARLRGVHLRFVTDAGVFSKKGIDKGTQLLIEHVPLPETGRVLDLGCGYGPIGITLAKVRPDLDVVMVDVNARAVLLAERNAALNGVANVRIEQGDGVAFLEQEGAYAAIVSNPPYRAGKRIVFGLVEAAFERLEQGGGLTLVGQTKQGVKSLAKHVEKLFGHVKVLAKDGGYRVITASKGRE